MRLSAKAPIVIRGEEITHLDADGYKHLPRATALPDGKVLVTSNGAWRASDLSGVSVSSVFGRTGAVVAQTGDYTAAQVGAEPYAGVPAQTSFWRSTAAGVRAWVQLVAADITDLATVLAGYLTKNNPSWTGTMDGGSGATFRMSSLQGGLGNDFVCADMIGFIRKVTPSQALTNMQGMSLALKGAANGVAELGADGKVPSAQLPSYVDDVLEYATFSAFPATGETGKIYVNLDQNKTWRWSGSAYVEISASLALGETSATAYRGDRGKIAYDHSQATGNPHGTTAADVGAFPTWYSTGGTDFNAYADPGAYRINGTGWVNGWAGLSGAQQVALIQAHGGSGLKAQIAADLRFGGLYTRSQMSEYSNSWLQWCRIWDADSLPVGSSGRDVLAAETDAAARTAITAAKAVVMSSKSGDWSLDGNTELGIRQTASGTLTLPAASAAYGGNTYTITATTTLTLTIAGSFCYLDPNNSASYWYDTATSVAFVMNGGHSSGNRKKIKIYCDGLEWLVKC